MKIALIICTYMRPKPLLYLLQSINKQTLYPDQIIIVDGSTNHETQKELTQINIQNFDYFCVTPENRGLTRQRNFGISKLHKKIDIVAFLDDDTILEENYFEIMLQTFRENPAITGVGGVATNENGWQKALQGKTYNTKLYRFEEEFVYKEGFRNVVRNYLGLGSQFASGIMPKFSHGQSCGYPLTGKLYEVDLLIGMSFAFRKQVVDEIQFSKYFEGYGLYEDADFSIRALAFGKNVIQTKLQLKHFHDPSGRPNHLKYGKMVVRNGWYVWRTKNPYPEIKDRLKWHAITILLIHIRFINIFTTTKPGVAFFEAVGRSFAWWQLLIDQPISRNKKYENHHHSS